MSKRIITLPRFGAVLTSRNRRFFPALVAAILMAVLLSLELPGQSLTARAEDQTPASIWSSEDVPSNKAASDPQAVVLGTRFRTTQTVEAAGVKFYKASGNTGQHIGYLWTGGGQLLGTVAFERETESGWQSASFPQLIKLSANSTYVVGYLAPRGHYAYEEEAFEDGPIGSGALRGVAGVYNYNLSFPESTWHNSAYYVDIAAESVEPSAPSGSQSPTPTSQTSSSSSTAAAQGCAARPSACGYPDGSNTGVSDGAALRDAPGDLNSGPGWHVSGRSIVVDTPGTVLENIQTSYSIEVMADNVTVRNVRSHVSGETWGVGVRHADNVVIEKSEFTVPSGQTRLLVGIKDIYGDAQGLTIRAVEIAGAGTGIQVYGGLVADNYIHDMGYREGDHINGFTSNGSTRPLVIQHNTILVRQNQTDAVSLFQDFGVEANRTITDNLLAGGGYTVYGGDGQFGPTSNIVITNNRFSRIYYPNGGYWGPIAHFEGNGAGNRWAGNIWDDTLLPLNLGSS